MNKIDDMPGSADVNKQDDKQTSGTNISYWLDSTRPIKFSPLDSDAEADVVVVGGGIAGITTAYILSKNNYSVIVADDGNIGSGETGRTTAHISNALDDRYYNIVRDLDEERAKLAVESHTGAITFIEQVVAAENIDCDFARVDGYLMLHSSDNKESLNDELEASRNAGLQTELTSIVPGIVNSPIPVLKFPAQAQFHPLKYLDALCKVITSNGGRIYTGTHIAEVNKENVKTSEGFTIKARHIVVATNVPVNDMFVIHTKQAPYRSYVIAAKILKGSLPYSLWWDTGDHNSEWPGYPYHYVRLQQFDEKYDLLISGGEDHKTGQPGEEDVSPEDRYMNLVKWTKRHFPLMEDVIYRWSGQIMEPVDHLAFIGRNPLDAENIYIATGDSGNGITHGTIAGILISDLIAGRKNNWEELYEPSRKTFKPSTINTFIEEQANVAKQYIDYLTKGDIESVNDLPAGEGAIIRDDLNKAAVYRDENGKLYAFSAVCPHLKCIVEWNSDEKTFDCPCHGSRFTALGIVINGPANKNLDEVGVPD